MKNLTLLLALATFCFTSEAQTISKKEIVVEAQLGDAMVTGEPTEISDLTKQTSLVIMGDNDYTVKSFRMIKAPKSGPATMNAMSGSELSEDAIGTISRLKPGDRLIFEGILITSPTGASIKVSPIVYTAK